jgi:hypothetical protein
MTGDTDLAEIIGYFFSGSFFVYDGLGPLVWSFFINIKGKTFASSKKNTPTIIFLFPV